MADHPDPLRLAPGQRPGRPVQRQVAEPDLDERIEGVLQAGEQRRDRRLVQPAQPVGEVVDLQRARLGDVEAPGSATIGPAR